MALLKTREHGLDLAKIACRTVELVLSDILLVRAYCTSIALTAVQESPETEPNASLETRITLSEKDTGLIRSLEWLTFDESTHEEALRQANALCRYFMGTLHASSPALISAGLAKPHAARALLLLLPRQLVSNLTASQAAADTNTTSDHALRREMTEYLDFTAFFACLETHTHWTEVWSRKPKSTYVSPSPISDSHRPQCNKAGARLVQGRYCRSRQRVLHRRRRAAREQLAQTGRR